MCNRQQSDVTFIRLFKKLLIAVLVVSIIVLSPAEALLSKSLYVLNHGLSSLSGPGR